MHHYGPQHGTEGAEAEKQCVPTTPEHTVATEVKQAEVCNQEVAHCEQVKHPFLVVFCVSVVKTAPVWRVLARILCMCLVHARI